MNALMYEIIVPAYQKPLILFLFFYKKIKEYEQNSNDNEHKQDYKTILRNDNNKYLRNNVSKTYIAFY